MKLNLLLSLALTSLVATNASAMSKNIAKIENETINSATVVSNFNLRATDGSVLKFLSRQALSDEVIGTLPPPGPTDPSLCETTNTAMFIKLGDIALSLLDSPRALTPAEAQFLSTVPRCDSYSNILTLIASAVKMDPAEQARLSSSEKIKSFTAKLSKKNGNYLVLNTTSKKSASFKISGSLEGIREVRDLDRLKIQPSSSGQNIGIRFKLAHIDEKAPDRSRDHESCSVTEVERQCRYDRDARKEICEDVRVTREGVRRVIRTSQQTYYRLDIELFDAANKVVATGEVLDLDWDTDTRYGPCESYGRRH